MSADTLDTVHVEPSEQRCCYMVGETRCSLQANWRIEHGGKPDDYTESCTVHVGALLTDAPEHRIYPLTPADG